MKKLTLLVLILMTACTNYRAQPLTALPQKTQPETIAVAYKAYSRKECKKYLGRDVISKGYQPVQISIHNNTRRFYNLSEDCVDLPIASSNDVADKVLYNPVVRGVGAGIAGATSLVGIGILTVFNPIMWPAFFVLAAGAPLVPIVTGVSGGMKAASANKRINEDFLEKSAIGNITIAPHTTLNRILFIPKEHYHGDFTIHLYDYEEKTSLDLVASAS